MIGRIWLMAVVLCVLNTPSIFAQQEGIEVSKPDAVEAADLRILEQFLNLTDAELARIQALIQTIRDMSLEEKEAYQSKIREFHALAPGERSQIRQGWGQMSDEIRQGWMDMMHSLPDEERSKIQKRMFEMESSERNAYRKGLVEDYLKKMPTK